MSTSPIDHPELTLSLNSFRAIVDQSPAMMWFALPGGNSVYVNRAKCAFVGSTQDELLGYGWLEFVHADDTERMESTFVRAKMTEDPFSVIYRLRHADGAYRWVISTIGPIRGATGDVIGYAGVIQDLSIAAGRNHWTDAELEERRQVTLCTVCYRVHYGDFEWRKQTEFTPWKWEVDLSRCPTCATPV